MPKIGQVEFKLGRNHGSWIDAPTKELTLHFDHSHDYFYFKADEIRKIFPDITDPPRQDDFKGCTEKQKAINIIQVLIDDTIKPIKMLSITIKVSSVVIREHILSDKKSKVFDDLRKSKAIEDGYNYGNDTDASLGINLKRYMVYKFTDGNDVIRRCDENWRVDNRYHSHNFAGALMSWTEEREAFILEMLGKIDQLGTMVMEWLLRGMTENNMDFGSFIDSKGGLALSMGTNSETK